MRIPEEIKKTLRFTTLDCIKCHSCVDDCPYNDDCIPLYDTLNADVPRAMLRDAIEYIEQLERERDDALTLIGKLTVILKKYPYAATNGCAYEAYTEIKKYLLALSNRQEECK